MTATRTISGIVLTGALAVAVAGLGWLVFGAAEPHGGARPLAEVPAARVDVIARAAPTLAVEDVAKLPESAWERWSAHGYLSARPGEAIWVRARLANGGAGPLAGVLADTSYFSDRVDAWWRGEAKAWHHDVSGDAIAGREKPLGGRTAAFPVAVPAGGERTIYLRVSDRYVAHVQPAWWAGEAGYFDALVHSVLAECLCYGALLALVFYNLVLWARLRFPDLGYYVLSAGASAAGNLLTNGVPALAGFGLGSPWHETLMAAAFAAGGLGMLEFTRVFLGTAELLPRGDRALRIWRAVLAAGAAGVLAMPWMSTPAWLNVVGLAAMANEAACMAAAIAAWRHGAGHARLFLLAFAMLFVAAIPTAISLVTGKIVPGTAMGLLAGRTLEMLLLSFAVARRFARTQQRLVEETEQRRVIERAYAEELELEVRERTRELAEANTAKDRMLAVIGHDLRSPLTGLMRAADHAPGEFAREVSRTGRTLLLLIEDLVLWARLRAGRRVLAEHPATAVTAAAVALHRALADQDGIELAVAVPPELRVQTDLVLAQTLVRNLLANALKFARRRVALRAEAAADGVHIVVGNDGPPLPAEVAARLAAGADEPMTATGGLGLRLCREISRALGHRLEAGTAADGATEFRVILPVAAGEP